MRADQLTTGTKFALPTWDTRGNSTAPRVYEVVSVEQAEDAAMFTHGGCDVPDMSRSHQVKVTTTTPGVSVYLDKDRDVEIVGS